MIALAGIGRSLKALWNPSMLLAIVLSVAAAGASGYWKGSRDTENRLTAERLTTEQIAETAYRAAITGAAYEISKIQITNKTFRQTLEREIRHEPVYIDCQHPDNVKRLLDAILTGEAPAESLGGDSLPETDGP